MESSVDNAVIIMVNNHEPALLNKDLTIALGEEKSNAIQKYLHCHTAEVIANVHCHRFVFYSGFIHLNDAFADDRYTKFLQEGNDAAENMRQAFNKVFALGHTNACMVDSNVFALQPAILQEALHALVENDVVIGPTTKGSIYLLGMKQTHAPLFETMQAAGDTVYAGLLHCMETMNFCYHELESLQLMETIDDVMDTNLLALIEE